MRIVLDTNVLVSALLTPTGQSAQILQLFAIGKITLVLNNEIYSEYQRVLARPKFMFDQTQVRGLLELIAYEGQFVISLPVKAKIPDPKDRVFLEVAIAANADAIVTGNQKHFPRKITEQFGIAIHNPSQFLEYFSSRK